MYDGEEIENAIKHCLNEHEAKIIRSRFGLGTKPKTLGEIACEYGITALQLRQIERKVLDFINTQRNND